MGFHSRDTISVQISYFWDWDIGHCSSIALSSSFTCSEPPQFLWAFLGGLVFWKTFQHYVFYQCLMREITSDLLSFLQTEETSRGVHKVPALPEACKFRAANAWLQTCAGRSESRASRPGREGRRPRHHPDPPRQVHGEPEGQLPRPELLLGVSPERLFLLLSSDLMDDGENMFKNKKSGSPKTIKRYKRNRRRRKHWLWSIQIKAVN